MGGDGGRIPLGPRPIPAEVAGEFVRTREVPFWRMELNGTCPQPHRVESGARTAALFARCAMAIVPARTIPRGPQAGTRTYTRASGARSASTGTSTIANLLQSVSVALPRTWTPLDACTLGAAITAQRPRLPGILVAIAETGAAYSVTDWRTRRAAPRANRSHERVRGSPGQQPSAFVSRTAPRGAALCRESRTCRQRLGRDCARATP